MSPTWATSGRTAELATLARTLDEVEAGRGGFVTLVGEAGIGKTRLVEEITGLATGRGWRVAVGRCSQDESVLPLWPWTQVLGRVGIRPQVFNDIPEPARQFRMRAETSRLLREGTEAGPVLAVIEDLHWADPSTLGVLRLIAEALGPERLLVLATWRSPEQGHPGLESMAAALARRHALRLNLGPIEDDAAAALFEDLCGVRLSADQAAELARRTGGNPFFVVELARFARRGGPDSAAAVAGQVLSGTAVPEEVSDIVALRLASLPAATQTVLRSTAVIGTETDLDLLAEVTDLDPDALLDALDPALDAGVVTETDVDRFAFTHALVRDTLYGSMTASRRARAHAQLAALLQERPGHQTQVAWHWRWAGPAHTDKAWRALVEAATAAMATFGYTEAADLLTDAAELQAHDPAATDLDRVTVLWPMISACRGSANLPGLVVAVETLIEVARRHDDLTLMGSAATQTGRWTMWRSAGFGQVNRVVVDALRQVVETLDPAERELAARARVSLANEAREEMEVAQRVTLCREGIAMARELDDPLLLADLLQQSCLAIWHPDTGEERIAMATEAAGLADPAVDRPRSVVCDALVAVTASELGRIETMRSAEAAARRVADGLHVPYVDMLLDELQIGWAAASGDRTTCEKALERVRVSVAAMAVSGEHEELSLDRHVDLFTMKALTGRVEEAVADLDARIAEGFPMQALAIAFLWRAGREDEARDRLARVDLAADLDRDIAFANPVRAAVAEVAFWSEDADLATRALARLEPLAGRQAGADGIILGPIDLFLALASSAAGRQVEATAHADRADALIRQWGISTIAEWFAPIRATHGF